MSATLKQPKENAITKHNKINIKSIRPKNINTRNSGEVHSFPMKVNFSPIGNKRSSDLNILKKSDSFYGSKVNLHDQEILLKINKPVLDMGIDKAYIFGKKKSIASIPEIIDTKLPKKAALDTGMDKQVIARMNFANINNKKEYQVERSPSKKPALDTRIRKSLVFVKKRSLGVTEESTLTNKPPKKPLLDSGLDKNLFFARRGSLGSIKQKSVSSKEETIFERKPKKQLLDTGLYTSTPHE